MPAYVDNYNFPKCDYDKFRLGVKRMREFDVYNYLTDDYVTSDYNILGNEED